MRNFAYQFALGLNKDGGYGLVFSTESETINSPIFAIPVSDLKSINENFLFPGEINGKYVEFNMIFINGRFKIQDERIGYDINFTLHPFVDNLYTRNNFFNDSFYRGYQLNYIGNEQIFEQNERFQIIVPTDLILLDELYKEKGFCIVGFTPVFNGNEK